MLNPRESSIISVSFTDDCEIIQGENLPENVLSVMQYILRNATLEEMETIIGIGQEIVEILKKYE